MVPLSGGGLIYFFSPSLAWIGLWYLLDAGVRVVSNGWVWGGGCHAWSSLVYSGTLLVAYLDNREL
jgi:hypothetical protein